MESNENKAYFTNEALARFLAAQGRIVKKVICYLWQNVNDKDRPVELIDTLQLQFGDDKVLSITCNSEGDGLDATEYDHAQVQKELKENFGDKIRVFTVDASSTTMWKDVIEKELILVKISRVGDLYFADSIVLDFGEERREISIGPLDGLVIDYYED